MPVLNKLKIILIASLIFLSGMTHAETVLYTEDKPAILLTPAQPEFVIKLKSNATTGYSWFLRKYDPHFVQPVKHVYQASTSQLVGSPGFELWTFRAKPTAFIVPQVSAIYFIYARPCE